MADTSGNRRPLSPHLTIYRPQITSVTSILNRITGNALLVGALLIVAWLLAAATSEAWFSRVDWLLTSWLGDLVMALSLWALWYHALGGLRHLIWDAGYGLELEVAEKLGWGVIIGSVLLTLLSLLAI